MANGTSDDEARDRVAAGAAVLSERPLDDPAILALRKPAKVTVGLPGDDLDSLAVDCRGEPLDLGPEEPRCQRCRALLIAGQCSNLGCFERPTGSATRADLEELDAVPEPVDSDAPREVHQTAGETQPYDLHARTLARARP